MKVMTPTRAISASIIFQEVRMKIFCSSVTNSIGGGPINRSLAWLTVECFLGGMGIWCSLTSESCRTMEFPIFFVLFSSSIHFVIRSNNLSSESRALFIKRKVESCIRMWKTGEGESIFTNCLLSFLLELWVLTILQKRPYNNRLFDRLF